MRGDRRTSHSVPWRQKRKHQARLLTRPLASWDDHVYGLTGYVSNGRTPRIHLRIMMHCCTYQPKGTIDISSISKNKPIPAKCVLQATGTRLAGTKNISSKKHPDAPTPDGRKIETGILIKRLNWIQLDVDMRALGVVV